jgi:sugar fermentation stimulation protein A
MRFPAPLVRATLIRRYKRFLADVTLETGEMVTVHVANPGTMLGLVDPGNEVWLSRSGNPARKLPWTWELVRAEGTLVGVNTAHPNAIVSEAVAAGTIPELTGYPQRRREVKYGTNSRIDLLLEADNRPVCFVEVKNVHMARGGQACFPDSVTARGTKHLAELSAMVRTGARAVMLFLIQRDDCPSFTLADDIDPTYAAGFDHALAAGVEVLCYACRMSLSEIVLERRVALDWPHPPSPKASEDEPALRSFSVGGPHAKSK